MTVEFDDAVNDDDNGFDLADEVEEQDVSVFDNDITFGDEITFSSENVSEDGYDLAIDDLLDEADDSGDSDEVDPLEEIERNIGDLLE